MATDNDAPARLYRITGPVHQTVVDVHGNVYRRTYQPGEKPMSPAELIAQGQTNTNG